MFPKSIQKLINLFVKFPTVGPRTAARFVFYLIKLPQEKIDELTMGIKELKESIKLCSFCFKPFQNDNKLCEICSNPTRDKTMLCLVEKETDLESIEKTQNYKGLYFILGNSLSKFDIRNNQELEKKIRIIELIERIKNPQKFNLEGANFKEIIIATNSTTEGEAIANYLEILLKKNLPVIEQITKLGRGLPMGGELEYADEETLSSALKSRR